MNDEPLEPVGGEGEEPPHAEPAGYAPSVAARMALYQRAGGLMTPILTALFAFLMGGIVVAVTGHNPFTTYKAIFNGTGFDWFFHVGNHHVDVPFTNHHVWFPWNTDANTNPAYNLGQTLLAATTLVLTGLSVAFAFRCGLFNIGGQGQYVVGAITGVYIGSRFVGLAGWQHILLAIAVASLAGGLWAAIAGFLKATVGAHEVITTIMLNWIASYVGQYLFAIGGPLQNHRDKAVPISDDVVPGAKLGVWWGNPQLQGLHIGFFISAAMLVVFWFVLNRTTLGYEVRAVGFNPDAARYGGVSVARNYIVAMAISGLFAGLAGALEILGYLFRIGVLDIQVSSVGFIGIAVALLGRNTAVGVGLAALLFGALITGTSTRNPGLSEGFPPELAGNLSLMIQALVLLFVGADVLIIYVWQARRKLGLGLRRPPGPAGEAA
jgi:ABC-type uncharacterized transport system permease subunit